LYGRVVEATCALDQALSSPGSGEVNGQPFSGLRAIVGVIGRCGGFGKPPGPLFERCETREIRAPNRFESEKRNENSAMED
jgi:hypothetical protein